MMWSVILTECLPVKHSRVSIVQDKMFINVTYQIDIVSYWQEIYHGMPILINRLYGSDSSPHGFLNVLR